MNGSWLVLVSHLRWLNWLGRICRCQFCRWRRLFCSLAQRYGLSAAAALPACLPVVLGLVLGRGVVRRVCAAHRRAAAGAGRARGKRSGRCGNGRRSVLSGGHAARHAAPDADQRKTGRPARLLYELSRGGGWRALYGPFHACGAAAGCLPPGPLCRRYLPGGRVRRGVQGAGRQPCAAFPAVCAAHGAVPPAAPLPAAGAGRA